MSAAVQDEYGSEGRKNHRVVVTRHGGPEVLQMVEDDLPEPAAGEVRVRVQAAGVSAYDLMQRSSGSLPGTPPVPYTPGEDVAGVVDKLGDGVTTVDLGQMVVGFPRGDGYAEFVCEAAGELVPVPEGVDPAQAVCLVANYLTAEMLLHPTAQVQPGERVLVHGAAGGVGSALVELGKQFGLEVYGTASKYNHELVSRLGATPIDYRFEDFVERIRSLTGDGVDAVFDPVGGASQIWRSYRTLRKGGWLISFGMAATKKSGVRIIPFSLLAVVLLGLVPDGKQARMSPNLAVFAAGHRDWYRDTLAELLDAVAAGRIDPVVVERVPLAEAARAHELIERGGYAGKVVLVPGAWTGAVEVPMSIEMNAVRLLGVAQLIVFVASMVSERLLTSVAGSGPIATILVNVSKNLTRVRISSLVTLLNSLAIVFLGVMFYVVFFKQYRTVALVALICFLAEAIVLAVSKIGAYGLMPLSREFVEAGAPDPSYVQALGDFLYHGVDRLGYDMHMLFFCLGGILWYALLYSSRLVPRPLSLWGLIAICLLSAPVVVVLYKRGPTPLMVLGLPYAPFELVLAVWLIVKG